MKLRKLIFGLTLAATAALLGAAAYVLLAPIGRPYSFLKGLSPISVQIDSLPSGFKTMTTRYAPDRNVEDVLAQSNREFGGRTGWKGDNFKKTLLCSETGWSRDEPGHVAGYVYRKGGEEVEIIYWYKRIGEERESAEPPDIEVTRPATLIDEFRVWIWDRFGR